MAGGETWDIAAVIGRLYLTKFCNTKSWIGGRLAYVQLICPLCRHKTYNMSGVNLFAVGRQPHVRVGYYTRDYQ